MKSSITQNPYKIIGSRIRALRDEQALSQQELADRAGFQTGTAISLIESGSRRVAIDDLEKIAEVLGVKATYLLGDPAPDLQTALRADEELNDSDKKAVINFYTYIKNERQGGGNR